MKKIFLIFAFLITGLFSITAQTLEEGLRALDFERYEYARNVFNKLTIQEPSNGDNFYYLGQAYFNLLQTDSALMAYNKGIAADTKNPKNFIGIGELNLNENKAADAKMQFEKALALDKGKDVSKSRSITTLRMIADAMISTETKLTDDALNYISQALELDKKNYNSLITAGDVYLEMNNGGESANNYERAIKIDTNNAKAYSKVSNIWLRVRNGEAALDALNKALAKDSNYAPALKNMAELYFMSKKYEKAKYYYSKYLMNSEESTANKIRFAQILFKTKEFEEALLKIEDIQRTDKNNVYLYRMAGYSYYEVAESKKDTSKYRMGVTSMEVFFVKIEPAKILPSDYEYYGKLLSKIPGRENDAFNNLSKTLSLDSSKIEIYLELAKVNNKLKKYDDAATNILTYISKKLNPGVINYALLGQAYTFGKQWGKADTAYLKVIELKPDYAPAYYYRAVSNSYLDPDAKSTIAKELYEKYVSLAEPTPEKYKNNLITAYDYLARIAIKNDDKVKAKEYLNKILVLDPENKTAKDYLKLIK